MSRYSDKYGEEPQEETSSDIRGIITQLNREKPSTERHREVVVRPDGTKVIRVTKKRRVLVSEKEKSRAGRRSFLMILLGAVVLCLCVGGYMLFSMSQMSGEAYVQKKAEELREAWGATKVECTGAGISGTSFLLTSLKADFPEGSLVQHVELYDIAGEIDVVGFFTKLLVTDELKIGRAEILLNPEVKNLQMPSYRGAELWRTRRMVCPNFTLRYGQGEKNVLLVENAPAYLYYPRVHDRSSCAFVLSGGVLRMRGMASVRLSSAKFLMNATEVEEFFVKGTTDDAVQAAGREVTSLSLLGRLPEGASFAGPFEFDADNMPFGDFTQNRLENILSARTVSQTVGSERSAATILLPTEQEAPVFNGEFRLKNISLIGFPAQTLLLEHMLSSKRKKYQPAKISQGRVLVQREGENLSVEFPADKVVERDLLALHGKIQLNAANEISGTMDYGLPTILTHAEYANGKSDPIFREDVGTAWLCTTLSGTVNRPSDNSAQLDAEAVAKRAEMSDRISLEDVDLEQVADQLKKEQEQYRQLQDTDTEAAKKRTFEGVDPFADPLE